MKILKHGDFRPRIFKCLHCGCEFVAGRREYGQELTDYGKCYGTTCPECSKYDLHLDSNCEVYDGLYEETHYK